MTNETELNQCPELNARHVKDLFQKAKKKRVIFLDYDGTIIATQRHPEFAYPSKQILKILHNITLLENTYVYILCGRTRKFLNYWFGDMDLGLCAEHGCFYRHPSSLKLQMDGDSNPLPMNHGWVSLVDPIDMSWREAIMPIFHHYRERTPGSDVEEKEVSSCVQDE